MPHDFDRFPELTNDQLSMYQFSSPHPQITEDFEALVVKVIDGDTVKLRTDFRDFDFKLRFADIDAPELNESEGNASKEWLKDKIENKVVQVLIDRRNRVDKWGRLLGRVFSGGMNLSEESLLNLQSVRFSQRNDGEIPNIDAILKKGEF